MKPFMLILPIIAAVLVVSGCRSNNAWPPSDDQPAEKKIVLFAPVALGPLAEAKPEKRLDFAHDSADRVDLLFEEYEGRVGEFLPQSDSELWSEPVAAVAGADVVVLTTVTEIEETEGTAGPYGELPEVRATVIVDAVDVNSRRIRGYEVSHAVDVRDSPKMMRDQDDWRAIVVYGAISKGMGQLRVDLEEIKQLPDRDPFDTAIRPIQPLVDVTIDPTPSGAMVIVDGIPRGTTPITLPLPLRPNVIRIERQGYQVWEYEWTPEPGSTLAPALEPLRNHDGDPPVER